MVVNGSYLSPHVSCRVDNIYAEMIKVSGEPGVELYHKLCLKIWETEQWPEEWRKSVFVTLPKKGDLQQCSNYRTIALINHASKILFKIIMSQSAQNVRSLTKIKSHMLKNDKNTGEKKIEKLLSDLSKENFMIFEGNVLCEV